jgi:alkylation response protein AidB-like acyl-CoA dehydrogenase
MDLTWTPEERAFREEVRAFVLAKLPADLRAKTFAHHRLKRDDYLRWHRILVEKGWGAPSWPKEYGGTGWNAVQRMIFEIECFKAGAPRLLPFGLGMIGPVLIKYGSQEIGRASCRERVYSKV